MEYLLYLPMYLSIKATRKAVCFDSVWSYFSERTRANARTNRKYTYFFSALQGGVSFTTSHTTLYIVLCSLHRRRHVPLVLQTQKHVSCSGGNLRGLLSSTDNGLDNISQRNLPMLTTSEARRLQKRYSSTERQGIRYKDRETIEHTLPTFCVLYVIEMCLLWKSTTIKRTHLCMYVQLQTTAKPMYNRTSFSHVLLIQQVSSQFEIGEI